jgi:hypothetical protein
MYDSFRNYQTALLAEFDRLSVEYQFDTVDASVEPRAVFAQLKEKVLDVLESDSRKAFISKMYDRSVTTAAPKLAPAHHAGPAEGTRDLDLLLQKAAQRYLDRSIEHALDPSNGNGHGALHHK